jgi:DNA (cytosine-5)-methyltransferase 1
MAVRPYNVVELCAGVAGLGLGIHVAVPSARTIAYVEREAYAAATLVARMAAGDLAEALVWSNLATFDGRSLRGIVDCVASGDPCQPNSVAGKRGGAADDRFLIDQVLRIVDESQPGRLFRENVTGNADGQLAALVPALERLGYRVAAGIFSAAQVGAAHRRDRLFVMADREGGRLGELRGTGQPGSRGHADVGDPCLRNAMADAQDDNRRPGERGTQAGTGAHGIGGRRPAGGSAVGAVADADGARGEAWLPAPARRGEGHAGIADAGRGEILLAPGPGDRRWPEILGRSPHLETRSLSNG